MTIRSAAVEMCRHSSAIFQILLLPLLLNAWLLVPLLLNAWLLVGASLLLSLLIETLLLAWLLLAFREASGFELLRAGAHRAVFSLDFYRLLDSPAFKRWFRFRRVQSSPRRRRG